MTKIAAFGDAATRCAKFVALQSPVEEPRAFALKAIVFIGNLPLHLSWSFTEGQETVLATIYLARPDCADDVAGDWTSAIDSECDTCQGAKRSLAALIFPETRPTFLSYTMDPFCEDLMSNSPVPDPLAHTMLESTLAPALATLVVEAARAMRAGDLRKNLFAQTLEESFEVVNRVYSELDVIWPANAHHWSSTE